MKDQESTRLVVAEGIRRELVRRLVNSMPARDAIELPMIRRGMEPMPGRRSPYASPAPLRSGVRRMPHAAGVFARSTR